EPDRAPGLRYSDEAPLRPPRPLRRIQRSLVCASRDCILARVEGDTADCVTSCGDAATVATILRAISPLEQQVAPRPRVAPWERWPLHPARRRAVGTVGRRAAR